MNRLRPTDLFRCLLLAWLALGARMATALPQVATESESKTAPLPALSPYVLPDKTASIKLPADWHVVQTGIAFIRAQGPNGELAMFGVVVPAHEAASTDITPGGVNQTYAAPLKDKFTQSMGWVLQRLGKSAVPVNILSDTSFKAPPAFGNCSNFTMLLGAKSGIAAEADFCSLPVDNTGNYKNFFKIVGLGSAHAKQERATLEAILASYQLNMTAIKQQQANAAHMPPAPTQNAAMPGGVPQNQGAALVSLQQQRMAMQLAQAQANAIQSSTAYAYRSSMQSADTFDHNLRGDTAVYGSSGSQPLFWLSD